jgi:hypothetical protein
VLSIFEGRPIVLFEKFDVDRWVDAIVRYKIRFASLPPTPMRMVLDARVPREEARGLARGGARARRRCLPKRSASFESTYGVPVLIQLRRDRVDGRHRRVDARRAQAIRAAKLGECRAPTRRGPHPASSQRTRARAAGWRGRVCSEVMPERRLGDSQWTRTTDLPRSIPTAFLHPRPC